VVEIATQTRPYLYAIVAARQAARACEALGIEGGEVYPIVEGALAAVVSDIPHEKVRPERRHLAAHHAVHKYLLGQGALLPTSFGIIADGPEAVRRMLVLNREAFTDQLQRVEGKVEMTLRVVWDVTSIFEYFVRTHPELRILRDRMFGGGRDPSADDKIDLGRLFDRMLNEDRAADTQRVVEILGPLCAEVRENPPRTERDVANLACLIDRDAQPRFQQGVFEAAKNFDDNYSFDYSGPWPPYNFVEVDLKT
jgi:hypothetical protein